MRHLSVWNKISGNTLIYDIHGKLVKNFLLLDAVATDHIVECHFWGNGVVAISSNMQLYAAEVRMTFQINVEVIIHTTYRVLVTVGLMTFGNIP